MQVFRHQILTDGVGFDNIAAAMVSVIQILTYAAWSYMMYRMTDTYGMFTIIYFILCVVLGCYFVVSPVSRANCTSISALLTLLASCDVYANCTGFMQLKWLCSLDTCLAHHLALNGCLH